MKLLPKISKHWLFLILIIATALRLPSLFGVYSYGDECIYLSLGQGLKKGLLWYKEIHDNKPPFLYLIAAISGNLYWFRTILLIWSLITIYFFSRLSKFIFAGQKKVIVTTTFVFSLLITLPIFEGGIANAENFLLFFTIAGILRLLCGNYQVFPALVFGMLLSFSSLLKVPAITDFIGIIIFYLFFLTGIEKHFSLINKLKILFSMGIGFLLPQIIFALYYLWQNGLKEYLIAAYLQNFGYLSTWKGSNTGLYLRTMALASTVILLWIFRKKISTMNQLILIWFLFSLYGALLSDRPYPHYLLQTIPSLSMIIGLIFTSSGLKHKIISTLPVVIFLFIYFINFWHYPILPYYQNFLNFAVGMESKEQYRQNLGAKNIYPLADFLNRHSYPDERTFVWGEEASCVYALSKRLPPGKYVASYHIIDFNGQKETIDKIESVKPKYIIDLKTPKLDFKELSALINNQYDLYQKIGFADIYLLKLPQ